ncbi:MAG: tetratricopeptide repeat protein, partial [Candidatus Omnitrophica bacterium]|nr:tetratricopeptide repeat protein [Candidatus Omnitrophota bacterium]
PKAHNNLGNAYRAANKREEAIASYKKAIKIDPGYAPAYDNLAAVYIQEKQFKLAIGYCDRANELGLTNVAHLETLKPYR